tara:strand:- start:1059 stop:1832 length:774 start_codon:yes stop_codon:yes gene_type:complete
MKELKLSEIQKNWDRLRNLINNTFEGERLEKLNKMYDYFEDRMCVAPASGTEHFHNAHVGGYVEHVLHVVDLALKFTNVWDADGATIDFTVEEIIFAALHHDLGKIGDLEEDYYIPQESEWHRKNRGEIFTHNPKLNYMTVTDRAVFLLNHFGLDMSEKEYIGIRLTDGLYEEANKKYYITYTPGNTLKTNIAYILHQADMAASHIEYDEWKRGELQEEIKVEKKVENIKKAVTMEETSDQLSQKSKDLFDELFGDK